VTYEIKPATDDEIADIKLRKENQLRCYAKPFLALIARIDAERDENKSLKAKLVEVEKERDAAAEWIAEGIDTCWSDANPKAEFWANATLARRKESHEAEK
jgi:hypothetical protein